MQAATLRLFRAIQIDGTERSPEGKETISPSLLERTIRNGYLLDPAISPSEEVLALIESVVGISGEKANATFHKSWRIVRDSPIELLWLQQIIHYITTYGFERLGIYRQDAVYIPAEALELLAIQNDIPLIVIKALDAQEVLKRIINLGSGIALAQETLNDLIAVVKANDFDPAFIDEISNREFKALLYDHYGLGPSEPIEFLRYLIFKVTAETLLIKNDALIEKIKKGNGRTLDALLSKAPADLASIFLRYKPLFLAMKSISRNKTFFNRLRKQAVKLHAPLPEDYLNSVTVQIKERRFDLARLEERLAHASSFRKVRLAYALQQRLHPGNSILYRIRNGRGWVTQFAWSAEFSKITSKAQEKVLASLVADLRPTLEGKTVYIPPHVHYALPATEKQFTGFLPSGSCVAVEQDLIVGIHWTDTNKRIDLDLSVIGASGKIGWDADYRNPERTVLFSGDMTDAPPPDGASELFYLKQVDQEPRLLFANYFNFEDGDEIGCKILVASEKPENFGRNYVVDVNRIVATANIVINKKQNLLGLLANVNGENRVYFANVSVGNSISARADSHNAEAIAYLVRTLLNPLDFREILRQAGAQIVDTAPQDDFLDLSPNNLDKTTFIQLLKTKE